MIDPVEIRTDPVTPHEWQEAVDAAHLWLLIDAARQYGLVTGGPAVDVGRCEEILAAGATAGFRPRELSNGELREVMFALPTKIVADQ